MADAYGFSVYIWNVKYIYALADKLRRHTDAVLLMGGPEVTFDTEVALAHIAIMFCVERERNLFSNLYRLSGWEDVRKVPALCFIQQGRMYKNPPAAYIDLDQPRSLCRVGQAPKRRLIYYESSRGCPFSCAYCLSSAGKQLRFCFSGKKSAGIFQHFAEAGVMKVKFVDRTF